MPICPTCNSTQLEGTFFCTECGGSLLPTRKRETTASLGVVTEWETEAVSVPAPLEERERGVQMIRLMILNSGRRISLSLEQPILIGRQDPNRGFYPDVDLSGDGGLEAGVSRRHARLFFREGDCYVEDLESANGTFIGRDQLSARAPEKIQSGDELRLGTIVIRVDLP